MTLEVPSEWKFDAGRKVWCRVFENADVSEIQPVDSETESTRKFKWVYSGTWGLWEGTEDTFELAKQEAANFNAATINEGETP